MQVTTIFGPPGTGKTRRLIELAEQYPSGVFLSYTKAAAAEAVSRLPKSSSIRASTVHSLAFNALSMNRAAVVDREKLRAFGKASGIPFKGSEEGSDEEQEGDQYQAVMSYAHNRIRPYMEAFDHFGCPGTRQRFQHFIDSYASWKKTYGYMDFDDMLVHFATDGTPRHKVVFVDEAQDCTPLQWHAIIRACERADQVFIAGDDDQAIYEWSGADPHGMVTFTEEHEGETTILAKSHRLTARVWQRAIALTESMDKRVDKKFEHKGSQGPEIDHYGHLDLAMQDLKKLAPDGAMVLCRDRFKLGEAQKNLNRDLIPYDVYGGMSPWTSKTARALLSGELTLKDVAPHWRDFYQQAYPLLKLPIRYFLSTIHAAKGREHDTVIMDLDCPPRVLRNIDLDRDSEVRVQYVGVTRSKNKLILCGGNPIV